jgi:hypothetical protein
VTPVSKVNERKAILDYSGIDDDTKGGERPRLISE